MPPNQYVKHADWKAAAISKMEGHANKNCFLKKKRETFNEEVMRVAKQRKHPAPGYYEVAKTKIQNIPKTTSP